MKKLLSGIMLLCLAAGALFFSLIVRSDRPKRAHTSVKRQYDRIRAVPVDTFKVDGAVHLLAAFEGQVYALDQKAGLIFGLEQGKNVRIIAKHGQYFPEIPASFQATGSGVFCFVANQRKIYHFPLRGGPPDSLQGSGLPFSRGAHLPGGNTFIHYYDTLARKAQFLLADYRNGGKKLKHLHDFPHENDGGLASDGQVISAGGQLPVVYFQHHNGVVYVWDTLRLRSFLTIDRTPESNSIIHENGTWSISSKTHFINLDGATDGKFVYILSNAVSAHQTTSMPEIDIYLLADGSYAGSLHLPAIQKSPVRHIAAAGGRLYASYRQHVVAYQIEIP